MAFDGLVDRLVSGACGADYGQPGFPLKAFGKRPQYQRVIVNYQNANIVAYGAASRAG